MGPKNTRCWSFTGSTGAGSGRFEQYSEEDGPPLGLAAGGAAQWAAVPTKTRVAFGFVKTKFVVQPPWYDMTCTPLNTLAEATGAQPSRARLHGGCGGVGLVSLTGGDPAGWLGLDVGDELAEGAEGPRVVV
ncbi:MAG TPA: hypothetical protein VM286_08655 [Candidatus Thermoplasmatota archaeon]|nr:hypothetical protein [Candidatus Thermoplasmatota archaeon]